MEKTAGDYCVGNEVTLADCVLTPQVFNANRFIKAFVNLSNSITFFLSRFSVDMSKYPIISRINAKLLSLEVLKSAHPDAQPDRPQSN